MALNSKIMTIFTIPEILILSKSTESKPSLIWQKTIIHNENHSYEARVILTKDNSFEVEIEDGVDGLGQKKWTKATHSKFDILEDFVKDLIGIK